MINDITVSGGGENEGDTPLLQSPGWDAGYGFDTSITVCINELCILIYTSCIYYTSPLLFSMRLLRWKTMYLC